jgi:diacylglycerol kinase family enzyme
MRKAALLFNPNSGGRRRRQSAEVETALSILRTAGVDAVLTSTQSSAEATERARAAVADGCDTILACGGDGTIHDVLPAMVGSPVALGILPTGTANALAHDLGVPLNPIAAARAALIAKPRQIALGRMQYRDFSGGQSSRFFIVAAGIGVDAHLFYELEAGLKRHMGMTAYYAKATHLWLTHRMHRFQVEWVPTGGGEVQQATVSELLAVRIRNFGGVLQELAPGASLERDDMRLVLFRTTSRLLYLLYVIRGLLRRRFRVRDIELVHSEKVVCECLPPSQGGNLEAGAGARIYVEADGELVGTIPAEITVVPNAVTVLAP